MSDGPLAPGDLAAWREAYQGGLRPGRCPGDERLAALAEGGATGTERESLADHVAACPRCAESYRTLGQLHAEAERGIGRRRPWRLLAAAAAAVLTVTAGVAVWQVARGPQAPPPEALRSGGGDAEAAPSGRELLAAAPAELRWSPPPGARELRVRLHDAAGELLWQAVVAADAAAVILPPEARRQLEPGGEYYWTVEAAGPVARPRLGPYWFRLAGPGPAAWAPGAAAGRGVVVETVDPALAAARAGVRPGDVVVAWRRLHAGERTAEAALDDPLDLREVEVRESSVGGISLTLLRDGATRRVTLGAGPWGIEGRPAGTGDPLWQRVRRARERAAAGDLSAARAAFDGARRLAAAGGATWRHAAVVELTAESLEARLPPGAAAELWANAAELRRAAGEEDALARDLLALGRVQAMRLGELDGARRSVEEALAIRRRRAPGSAGEAEALSALGIVTGVAGDLDAAEARFRAALAILEAVDPGSAGHARALNNLGLAARRRGHLAEAQAYLEGALAVHRQVDPEGDGVAGTLNNLGVVARRRGLLAEAEAYWGRGLELRRRSGAGELEIVQVLGNLGNLAHLRGDLERAEALHREAAAVLRRLAPGSESLVATLALIAQTLMAQERLAEAEPLLREALDVTDREMPGSLHAGTLRRTLGELARRRGDAAAARRHLDDACARLARLASGGLDHAACLQALATLDLAEGHLERAGERLAEVVASARRSAPGSTAEAEGLVALAQVARRQGRRDIARQRFDEALAALDVQRSRVGGDDPVRARFAERIAPLYRQAALARIEDGDAAAAFHVLERYRARALLDLLADRDLLLAGELPVALRSERARLQAASERVRREMASAGRLPEPARAAAAARLAAIEAARRRLARSAAELAGAAAAAAPAPLTTERALATLPAGTVLLSYVVGAEDSAVVALGKPARPAGGAGSPAAGQVSAVPIAAGAGELAEEIAHFRALLQNPAPSPPAWRSLRRTARRLHRLLLDPVADRFEGVHALVLLPDGPLHDLPFAALVGGDGRFVAERLAVTISLSATFRARLPPPAAEGPVVVLADPAPPPATGGALPALAAARHEARAVTRRFPGALVLSGDAASEGRLKAVDAGPRIVHLAAHAAVDHASPLDSYVVLAAEPGEDGMLRAWEVFERVRCPRALVVLSGCETAAGPSLGGEGMVGITRAFHYAGASAILSSSWRVADRSTAALIDRFYAAYESRGGAAEALRRAQVALLRAPVAVPRHDGLLAALADWLPLPPPSEALDATAPFHWAAFQVHGR